LVKLRLDRHSPCLGQLILSGSIGESKSRRTGSHGTRQLFIVRRIEQIAVFLIVDSRASTRATAPRGKNHRRSLEKVRVISRLRSFLLFY
jgi:large subunit ribosomal protein L34